MLVFSIENNQMLNMRRPREEVVAPVVAYGVVCGQHGRIAGLCHRVAAQINNSFWLGLKNARNDILVKPGAWWIDNNKVVARDVVERLFGWC